jgi:uncharacterized protein YjiS (DUF1127 family)
MSAVVSITELSKTIEPKSVQAAKPAQHLIRWIEIERLRVDLAYQREISKQGRKVIEAIAADFDWMKFGVLLIQPGLTDGTFDVIDGQHRAIAAQLCGASRVPCLVEERMAPEAVAARFLAVNKVRSVVSGVALFKARLKSGDRRAKEIYDLVSLSDVQPLLYQPSTSLLKAPSTFAWSELERLVRAFDPLTNPVLKCLNSCARADGSFNVTAREIRMTKNFLLDSTLSKGVDLDLLRRVKREETPAVLIAQSSEHRARTGDTLADSDALTLWRAIENWREKSPSRHDNQQDAAA